MAMLPFCGYNMGDYFGHWLKMGEHSEAAKLPKIFYVNWFRQNESGKYLWPGYGDNSRVLEWIFDRCDGTVDAVETPIGRLPRAADLDTKGLEIDSASVERLLDVDVAGWLADIPLIEQYFSKFGERLPKGMRQQVENLKQRLQAAKDSAKV